MVDNNNNSGYGPNFQFKGQVKIEDVKNQLDLLTDNINDMIDTYNNAGYVTDIDLNDVSSELSPMDYTLSVGGLRKVLDAYDGAVSGCTVFTDKNKENLYISSGILFTRNGGYGLPSAVIKNEGQKEIWYSPSKNQYVGAASTKKEESEFTQPKITSNESWGKISASNFTKSSKPYNWNLNPDPYATAFNGATDTGYYYAGSSSVGDMALHWTWNNFPSAITISEIQFTLAPWSNGSITTCWNDVSVYSNNQWINVKEGTQIGAGTYTVKVNNIISTGIQIKIEKERYNSLTGVLKNVIIKGTGTVSKPTGGGISDADDLVRVAVLDQNTDKNYLNINEFRIVSKNMRVAANTNNTDWTNSDTVDNDKFDRYIALLPTKDDSDLALYSKLYLPRGCSYTSWGNYPKITKARNISL